MTCCPQGLTDAGETGARDIFGERGQTMRMGCILTGLMEFALQILLGDLHIEQINSCRFALLCAVKRYVESPE